MAAQRCQKELISTVNFFCMWWTDQVWFGETIHPKWNWSPLLSLFLVYMLFTWTSGMVQLQRLDRIDCVGVKMLDKAFADLRAQIITHYAVMQSNGSHQHSWSWGLLQLMLQLGKVNPWQWQDSQRDRRNTYWVKNGILSCSYYNFKKKKSMNIQRTGKIEENKSNTSLPCIPPSFLSFSFSFEYF